MPDLKTVLNEKTFKDQGLEPSVRIFYTLTDNKAAGMTEHRIAKRLSLTVATLLEREILLPKDLDDMLLQLLT